MSLFRRKPLDQVLGETAEPNRQLKRALGPVQLTALGVGACVGAGIFSSIGSAVAGAPDYPGAGPAIIISFLLVAVACALAGFCYAEFAAMVPTSGSAYTYAYATLGELIAWVIGWDLILEYAVGNIAVAISWSGYFQQLLHGVGIHWLPEWLWLDSRSAFLAAQADGTVVGLDSFHQLSGRLPLVGLGLCPKPTGIGVSGPGFTTRPNLMPPASRSQIQPSIAPCRQVCNTD